MRNLPVLALCALCLLALMVVVNITRPLLPIDETRYLTVAWEYFSRDAWVLPTLNFEPYHHKPPMLFWLINAMWAFFGTTDIWAARLVTLVGTLGTLFMTHKIARLLWPETPQKADIATLMMAATPFFLIYGSLIMFDTLLAVAALVGVYALLKFYQGGSRWNFMLLALALGAGAVIKGPVILLHLLPLALLFPLLRRNFAVPRGLWFQGLLFGLMIGTALGLAWAIPAAKIGGPEYEQMIFWGQSAGRMVQSFDHARPFWFYLVTLPLMVLPWAFVPAFWTRGNKPTETRTWQTRFILYWILPVLLAFMMISGKQVHYLIPILPGLFMLLAHYIVSRGILDRMRPTRLYLWATLPITLIMAVVFLASLYAKSVGADPDHNVMIQLESAQIHFLVIGLVLILAIGRRVRRAGYDTPQTLRAVLVTSCLAVAALHFDLAPMLKKYYDLGALARVVSSQTAEERPVAVARAWHGEVGYLARLSRSVEVIQVEQMPGWLARNPRGIIILRHDADAPPKGYKTIYTQPYRSPTKAVSVLGR